jgi:hypothetical protein
MKPKKLKKNGKADSFDPQVLLDAAGVARKVADFRRGESIYSQGGWPGNYSESSC